MSKQFPSRRSVIVHQEPCRTIRKSGRPAFPGKDMPCSKPSIAVPRDCVLSPLTSLDHISDMISDPRHVFWLDVHDPTEQELKKIAEEFHLHPLAIEDATHEHQRPKIEQYEHFLFIVFYAVHLDQTSKELVIRELNLFVGKNYLITVHYTPFPELEEAEQRWRRNPKQREVGIGILLYSLLDTIVDQYFPIVDQLVDQAEALENHIFAGKAKQVTVTFALLALKKFFLQFRRIVAPSRDVLNVLTNRDSPLFDPSLMVYFRDVYDHLMRLADTLDLYRDQLGSTMDASLSLTSNHLNQTMRTLTAMSIILMSTTLVASVYGMNFNPEASPYNMPELNWPYGYFMTLGIMGTIGLLLALHFKRRRWL